VAVRALAVSFIWLAVALGADLPRATVVAGMVVAVVLAWWDELKRQIPEPSRSDDDQSCRNEYTFWG
jgi:uncharacterized membrane protein YraQ (UPF0718 family)